MSMPTPPPASLLHATMRLARLSLLGLLVGGAAAAYSSEASAPVPLQVQRQAAPSQVHASAHGMAGPVTLGITPARVLAKSGRAEQLEYRIDIAPSERVRTSAAIAYEIVQAQSGVVSTPTRASVIIPERAQAHHMTIKTPDDLADGVYLLRVASAVSNATGSGATTTDAFFELRAGTVSPLSDEEGLSRSGVNRARTIVSAFQPSSEQEARTHFAATVSDDTQLI